MKALLAITVFLSLTSDVKSIPDLNEASSGQECTQAFHKLSLLGQETTCSVLQELAACTVRVHDLHLRDPSSSDTETFYRSMTDAQKHFGLQCPMSLVEVINNLVDSLVKETADWLVEAWQTNATPDFLMTSTPVEGFESAHSKHDCVTFLYSSYTLSGGVSCLEASQFTECMFRCQQIYRASVPARLAEEFRNTILKESTRAGTPCSIDITLISFELQMYEPLLQSLYMQELPMRIESLGSSFAGFDDFTTLEECVTQLAIELSLPSFSCVVANGWAKCMVRVQDLHNANLSEEEITNYEETFELELSRQGQACDIDLHRIVAEMRGQGDTTTADSTVTTPSTSTTTDTTVSSTDSTTTTSTTEATPSTTTPVSINITTPSTYTTATPTTTTTTTSTSTTTPTTQTTPTPTQTTTTTTQTTTRMSTTTKHPNFLRCLIKTAVSCARTGNYAACFPFCQQGFYITCAHKRLIVRECPSDWYVTRKGRRFTARSVFDPASGRCVPKTPSCPRYLDSMTKRRI